MALHQKARGVLSSLKYADNTTLRFKVEDNHVLWRNAFPEYKPTNFEHPKLGAGLPKGERVVWADPSKDCSDEYTQIVSDFNKNNRISYTGAYTVESGSPINPVGRTGMTGRGVLGKWGPNHAADPLVIRKCKTDTNYLEFVAIKRRDNGEWAMPGGMVDAGASVPETTKREFLEEAANSLEKSEEEIKDMKACVEKLFDSPTKVIYKGYVDDPRNTDNAWMETAVTLFYDETGELTKDFKLESGDDAVGVRWMKIDLENDEFKLYASHKQFVELAVEHIEYLQKCAENVQKKKNVSSSTKKSQKLCGNSKCQML